MGVKRQPRALLAKVPGLKLTEMAGVRDLLRLRRHVLDQVRRDLDPACRQQVPRTSPRRGADAVVLGDLGCMLNIEGRLRRRGDAKTRVLHVAEVLAASAVELSQPCKSHRCISRSGRTPTWPTRSSSATCRRSRASSSTAPRSRCSELDDFEATREAGARDPPARARRSRRLAGDLRAQRDRARRDGAVGGDAGRDQRARARHRAPARRRARSSSRSRW